MRQISTALRGNTFERLFEISVEMLEVHRVAFNALAAMSSTFIRLKKLWLQLYTTRRGEDILSTLADFHFVLSQFSFYASTRFNSLFEKSLEDLFNFFTNNRELEVNLAQSMSLYPIEAMTESFKLLHATQRPLTLDIVERYLFFLSQGAIVTNLRNSSLNGELLFLRN